MDNYVYILYKLARVLGRFPPETIAATALVAITHPGVLGFVVTTVLGSMVMWWLATMFKIHVWPEIPPEHQRVILCLRDRSVVAEQDEHQDREPEPPAQPPKPNAPVRELEQRRQRGKRG